MCVMGCEPLLARGSGEHSVLWVHHAVSLKESQKMTEALGHFLEVARTAPLEPGDIALEDSPWYLTMRLYRQEYLGS